MECIHPAPSTLSCWRRSLWGRALVLQYCLDNSVPWGIYHCSNLPSALQDNQTHSSTNLWQGWVILLSYNSNNPHHKDQLWCHFQRPDRISPLSNRDIHLLSCTQDLAHTSSLDRDGYACRMFLQDRSSLEDKVVDLLLSSHLLDHNIFQGDSLGMLFGPWFSGRFH